jgi:spermidine synthase
VQQRSVDAAARSSVDLAAAGLIYVIAFVVGAIVMSFEMLGSRYLNPYFGSGIYTWAALISTVLAALTVGYFLGGWLADRRPSLRVLGVTVLAGSVYLLLLPTFSAALLEAILDAIDDIRSGSLAASFAVLFFPVTLFGMYSPFALTLGFSGLIAGLLLVALPYVRRSALLLLFAVGATVAAGLGVSRANDLVDESIRASLLKRRDGQIAHIESQYNDIYITKRRDELTMAFQLKGWEYTETVVNLREIDDLPVRYTRVMTVAAAYVADPRRVLMIGLGGGAISTYIGLFMPQVSIDTIEIDPAVIAAAKKYFGLRETPRVRYIAGDGRVMLRRSTETYDIIFVDAFRGGYIPFHLLTREFYTLLKERLAPGGAVAFNLHDGTRLYTSTLRTLSAVFPSVHLYPSGEGEVTAVVTATPAPDGEELAARAAAVQARYNFRFPLPELLKRRAPMPALTRAQILTDDFAPAGVLDAIGERERKRR